ncbi:MAG TPA: tetratricopeptide repeat protein, partial [Phycisphaerae bacterium]|nr:tetratricopeptide repeat protein [Phycisphaerae bacterium]
MQAPRSQTLLQRSARRAAGVLLLFAAIQVRAADPGDAQKLYNSGKYAQCIEMCQAAITPAATPPMPAAADPLRELLVVGPDVPAQEWFLLKAKAEMQIGQYPDADKSAAAGIAVHEEFLPLYLLRHQALRMSGRDEDAAAVLAKIDDVATQTPWHFDAPENRVALGQFMLLRGTDARKVLETYYDRARKDDPRNFAALMATGELALAKNDPGVAADSFDAARRVEPENPDVYWGLARANDDDPEIINAALSKALELNPNHVESMLMIADNLITRERYKDAGEMLDKILAVNGKEPRAFAYRAVIAHLRGDHKGEEQNRATALSTWKTNPEVDHLIGKKLSQNYRFNVGNDYQKKALTFDPNYQPAQFQLAEDLLRIGHEDDGWKLADEVFKKDPYNIMAYNLVTLRDRLARFKTLSSEHFVVRMDPHEAPVYGTRVMELLERART